MNSTETNMKISGKKIVVTGAAGFIGSNLVDDLLKHNNSVIGLDNLSTGFLHNLNDASKSSDFQFIEGDIRDLETCKKACKGADLVLHHAALGSVPRSIADPISTNDVNIGGFLNMLVAARDAKVKRFVFASSSSVYGDSLELPKVEERIGRALSPYAVTKQVNEQYARVFQNTYGMETIGLRYFNVYGRRQSPTGAYAAVIPLWIDALKQQVAPKINGDGENSRDFTYIDNVLQMNHLAAATSNKNAIGEIFNTAVGATCTLNELVDYLKNALHEITKESQEVQAEYGPTRPGDIPHSFANINKAKTILGYQPNTDFQACLSETVKWYLNH